MKTAKKCQKCKNYRVPTKWSKKTEVFAFKVLWVEKSEENPH